MECKFDSSLEDTCEQKGQLISLFSSKGGTGTTTLSINLAYEIQNTLQCPVVLLDLDQIYNNLGMMLNFRPEHSLMELADHSVDEIDEQILGRIIHKHPLGLDVVMSCKDILDETEMLSPQLLKKCLDFLRTRYSYVVVDLPSHVLDTYHQLVIEQSDSALLVTDTELSSLYRTCQYLNAARQDPSSAKIELIINRSNLPGAYGLSNKELEEQFGQRIFARISDDRSLIIKAASLSSPLSLVDMNATLVRNIQQLMAQVVDLGLNAIEPMQEEVESRPPLLSRVAGLGIMGISTLLKG